MAKRYYGIPLTRKEADKVLKQQPSSKGLFKRKIGRGSRQGLFYIFQKGKK